MVKVKLLYGVRFVSLSVSWCAFSIQTIPFDLILHSVLGSMKRHQDVMDVQRYGCGVLSKVIRSLTLYQLFAMFGGLNLLHGIVVTGGPEVRRCCFAWCCMPMLSSSKFIIIVIIMWSFSMNEYVRVTNRCKNVPLLRWPHSWIIKSPRKTNSHNWKCQSTLWCASCRHTGRSTSCKSLAVIFCRICRLPCWPKQSKLKVVCPQS